MSLALAIKLERENFSLDMKVAVPTNGITAIYGPSGSGKTTLLRCIVGLEKMITTGEIVYNGRVWLNKNTSAPVEERNIGYVFQEANLFPHLNVDGNLKFGLNRKKDRRLVFSYDDVVSLLGLRKLLNQDCLSLSGGEKQRVALGRAILSQPEILLLDEPFAALDKKSKQEILPYLESIHQQLGLPIILVSHSEEEIARLADYLIIVQAGRLMSEGKMLDMLSNLHSPLAQHDDCFGMIRGVVAQANQTYHLAQISFDGFKLRLPLGNLQAGQKVKVKVLAKDISICLSPPLDSSILNILPARITEIRLDDKAQCLVQIKIGGSCLIARISEYSKEQLNLKIEQSIFVQIKAMALID